MINIYCDESSHLENDGLQYMVLGAISCPKADARRVADDIRDIKQAHGLPPWSELKWVKVSPAKLSMYVALVEYFLGEPALRFRALIADKGQLKHATFGQSHDDWYYKMYFQLLNPLLSPREQYRVYLDMKDTRGAMKVRNLWDVLCNSMFDFDRNIIESLQNVRSHEIQQMQLADVLCGLLAYANRKKEVSPAKSAMIQLLRERTQYQLDRSTLLSEPKLNLFHWVGRGTTL